MPRYEIVAHVAVELEATTPEAAAAAFKQDLRAGAGGAVALRGLAVWRRSAGPAPAPLPLSVRRHLAEFFAGVARCAADAEAAFRARVEDIFASVAGEGPGADGLDSDAGRRRPIDGT